MSTNKDLLKQAIAEAKTIREAAIANAKEALEESLTPHLKEMLAQKLQEMENDEMEEEISEETINGAETESYSENPRRHGNVLREEEDEEAPEEDEKEPTEEEEPTEDEEEDIKIEDMSVEELKDLIRDIVAQETGAEDETEDDLGAEDMTGMEDGEEEIDINELLRELEEGSHEDKMEEYTSAPTDRGTSGGKDTGKEIDTQMANAIKAVAAKTGKSYEAISQFLFGGKKTMPAEFEEGVNEYTSAPTDRGTSHKDTGKEIDTQIANAIKSMAAKTGKSFDAISQFLYGGKSAGTKEMGSFEESVELQEALRTVRVLRSQLQEVNLLNAKLLYVNKVFKANNLTEGQKVNVVAAFDKAETVKEVKLVFETVSKNVVAKQPARPAIKEHKSFASKPAGSTQKQVINEVSEAVNRMQILAGIKQREF